MTSARGDGPSPYSFDCGSDSVCSARRCYALQARRDDPSVVVGCGERSAILRRCDFTESRYRESFVGRIAKMRRARRGQRQVDKA